MPPCSSKRDKAPYFSNLRDRHIPVRNLAALGAQGYSWGYGAPTIPNARPGDRLRKLFDGDGLYLSVSATGHKAWRSKSHIDGREKYLQFGRCRELTLKAARDRRLEARRALEMGKDPGASQKAERAARSSTFEALAAEWFEIQRSKLTPRTFENKRERFAEFVFPCLGKRPVAEIKALDMLEVLKRVEQRGRHETAHRVRSKCGNVFRYAVVT